MRLYDLRDDALFPRVHQGGGPISHGGGVIRF